ncbi:MAG: GNAT family N-acetyltransferase [Spirobacillus cienkowskii]|jgi:GNAT superfamily N-acetyltransferase|uniref:GNAT family N-acetyltransferase n=1 Tax=Spirobacillus cienkowskii TaxID=495820 RepID=A0A369KRW5_9BACT|nr:MAG: GNAT family N-acetyltransferase [Spirobacillus cienkowskii]
MSIIIANEEQIKQFINITQDARTSLDYPLSYVELFEKFLFDSFVTKRILNNKINLLDIEDNKQRGYISFGLFNESIVEVGFLFVCADFQNKGVGTNLLKHCEIISKNFNKSIIKIAAEPQSIDFYLKHNYILTDESKASSVVSNLKYPYVIKYLN